MRDEVCLRIRGLMPEKLIERAREMDIDFHAIAPRGDHEIVVAVGARDAEKLISLCRRFSIPCRVLSRRGRSALKDALKRRWTLLIGLLTALIACWIFLSHIWRIDVGFIGDSEALGDSSRVEALLDQLDIRPGMARSIDAKLLSEELMAGYTQCSYVGVHVEGVRLLVEIAPEAAVPEVYELRAARDLHADRGGIVVSVNVEAGSPCVKAGDTVRRGQLLIKGEERISDDGTRGIAALGEVVIRTWFEGSAEGALHVDRTAYTGRVSAASTLRTPWLDIPITADDGFEQQTSQTDILPIGGLYLPIRIERVTHRETRIRREAADKSALEARLSALAMADARARLAFEGPREYEITRCWTRVNRISDDDLRVSAVCEIHTNTAVTIEALRQGG